jgi:16S rRNA (guanine527-N7)-methyltransferase
MKERELLQSGLTELGIELGEERIVKLLDYLALLRKWNKVYNLTAIREKDEMVSLHLLDSLAVLPHLWEGRWLDVGCGGGVPGLVLAIARPDWEFTLLDSNTKKTSFVQQAAIELGLKNVSVHSGRVERWNAPCKFDGIISRAFAELSEFFQLTRHLLAPNGHWAAMKGQPEPELGKIPAGCEIERVIGLHVPGLNAARSLVIAKVTGERTA